MSNENTRQKKRNDSLLKVMSALNEITIEYKEKNIPMFPSTRDVANKCEMSIYNTRHVLIKLQDEGKITSVKGDSKKMRYWCANE